MAATKFRLREKAAAVDNAFKATLQIISKDAIVHFQKGFAQEGFTDNTLEVWQPRKNQIRALAVGVRGGLRNTKKTLTKSGKLRRSIKILNMSTLRITIGSDLPYAAIHNYGLRGNAWGRHPFTMPKRKFIGNSKLLEKRSEAKMSAKIQTAFKNG